jgi:hypothetical protein
MAVEWWQVLWLVHAISTAVQHQAMWGRFCVPISSRVPMRRMKSGRNALAMEARNRFVSDSERRGFERPLTCCGIGCDASAQGSVSRIEGVRERFGDSPFSRKDYLQLQRTITPVTASRDLKTGVEEGLLVRAGDKRTAVYHFSVKVPR